MPTVIVLPTSIDIAAFRQGRAPAAYFAPCYETREEADSYTAAVTLMGGRARHQITADEGLAVDVFLRGETFRHRFARVADKDAFLMGLEDADGLDVFEIYQEDHARFGELLLMMDATYSGETAAEIALTRIPGPRVRGQTQSFNSKDYRQPACPDGPAA